MSTISSVFKGYNAKRNSLPRSERAVTKHKPNGRLGKIITAVQQLKEDFPYYNWHQDRIDRVAKVFGYKDMQYHYTKGWRTV